MRKKRNPSAPGQGAAKSTVSGPSQMPTGPGNGAAVRKMQGTQALAAAFPFNASKAGEIGKAARTPKAGATVDLPEPAVAASTLTETNASDKTGAPPPPGSNPGNQPLEHVRVDSGGQVLTTNFAQPIADN